MASDYSRDKIVELQNKHVDYFKNLFDKGILKKDFNLQLLWDAKNPEFYIEIIRFCIAFAKAILNEVDLNLKEDEPDYAMILDSLQHFKLIIMSMGAVQVLREWIYLMCCVKEKKFEECLKFLESTEEEYSRVYSHLGIILKVEKLLVKAGGIISDLSPIQESWTGVVELEKIYQYYHAYLYEKEIINEQFDTIDAEQLTVTQNWSIEEMNSHIDAMGNILEKEIELFERLDSAVRHLKDVSSRNGVEIFSKICVQMEMEIKNQNEYGCIDCVIELRNAFIVLNTKLKALIRLKQRVCAAGGVIRSINQESRAQVAKLISLMPLPKSSPSWDPPSSMPHIDTIPPLGSDMTLGPVDKPRPALVYYPSEPTKEEWDHILSSTKGGIGLTGSAALGAIGPVLGKMDISESEDEYLFRVALPGVAKDDFLCGVDPTGRVTIKGVTTTGETTVYKYSMKFDMLSQNLCPPGHFSISFELPGPVLPHLLYSEHGNDGVCEGTVRKDSRKKPSA